MTQELTYGQKTDAAIRDLLLRFECQPILFMGSGISQRYFGAPTWRELLRQLFEQLPSSHESYDYYSQKFDDEPIKIGSKLSDLIFEWAWKDGRENFPENLFSSDVNKDVFIKHATCDLISSLTPKHSDITDSKILDELKSLSLIKPHAVITTNYDLFLESALDGYETITGQTILKYNTNSFGEIYHIHGDISDPSSIVLTESDYEQWAERKKYISAKLLTYFAEHPVFIFGYSLGDPNVKSILRDIGEIVSDSSGLIDNVYQVLWHPDLDDKHPSDQAIISIDGKEFRINAIHTTELKWVFDALRSRSALTSINPKLVRALAARTLKLVRHDIPSGTVAVDYDVLERVANDSTELPKLLGITTTDNPNLSHPYTLTQVAKRLGFNNWQEANKLLNKIKDEKGVDLRSTDNRYHCKIKTGNKEKSATRKWSHEVIDIMKKCKDGLEYKIDI